MEWRWANEHRLFWALDTCDPTELDDVLNGLNAVLDDPLGPASSQMHGTKYAQDRYIAPLPHGWVVVFTPHPAGLPPVTQDPVLVVRTLYKMFFYDSE